MQPEVIQKQLNKLRNFMLREEVGLSDEKAKKVIEVLDKYQEKDREIFKKLRATSLKLEALLLEDSNDQSKYKELIEEIARLRDERQSLKKKELDELKKLLSPKEQAKLILSLRDARHKFRRAMWGGGFGPPFMGEEGDEPPPPPPIPDVPGGRKRKFRK